MRADELQHSPQEAGHDGNLRQRVLCEISGGCTSSQSRRLPSVLSDGDDADGGNCHPFRDLNLTNLARRIDALFNHRWLTGLGNNRKPHAQPPLNPACDFLESTHEYMVTVHLPEVGHDQIIVMLDGNLLTVSAEVSNEIEERSVEKHFHRLSSQHSSFLLNFDLPDDVEGDEACMEFKGDLLIVHLPKRGTSHPRMIDLRVH